MGGCDHPQHLPIARLIPLLKHLGTQTRASRRDPGGDLVGYGDAAPACGSRVSTPITGVLQARWPEGQLSPGGCFVVTAGTKNPAAAELDRLAHCSLELSWDQWRAEL